MAPRKCAVLTQGTTNGIRRLLGSVRGHDLADRGQDLADRGQDLADRGQDLADRGQDLAVIWGLVLLGRDRICQIEGQDLAVRPQDLKVRGTASGSQ